MTKNMVALALLGSLLLCGCSNILELTMPTPTTEAQALAIAATQEMAERRGVRLDAVIFADPKKDLSVPDRAAAWAVCNAYAVGWNSVFIEEDRARPLLRAYAAHEVCHIYYKDNMPCKPPYDEDRAERCAAEILLDR